MQARTDEGLRALTGSFRWREHLEAMPELLNGIAMRTTGAAALAEYRREGALLFNRMREAANREIVRTLFHIRIEQPGTAPPGLKANMQLIEVSVTGVRSAVITLQAAGTPIAVSATGHAQQNG